MNLRTVPLIDARFRQSKLSLWLWRLGLMGLAITFLGGLVALFSLALIEVFDVIVQTSQARR